MKKEALRVSTTIPAAPTTLYYAWLNSDEHSQMTGATAKVDGTVGGKFSTWNGYITGKLVILDLGRRLVMAWRTTDFPRDAPDSRVEIHLEALGGSTRVTLLHTEIPEGQAEQYRTGWNEKYFDPMRAFFTKFLPDPRNPPPPRPPPPPPDDDDDDDEAEAASEPPTKKGPASKKPASAPAKIAKPEKKPEKVEKAPEKKADKKADKKPEKKADRKPEKVVAKKAPEKKAAKPDKKKPAKADKKKAEKTKPKKKKK